MIVMYSNSVIPALPSELLFDIFSICCSDGATIKGARAYSSQPSSSIPMPVVLSRVSSHRRQLATSYPSLWSDLRFKIRVANSVEDDDRQETRCCRVTEYFLQRASGAPLNLSFLRMLDHLGRRRNQLEVISEHEISP